MTQTCATPKYTLTAWNQGGKAVYIGFDAEVKGAGALTTNSQWYEGRSVQGWRSDKGVVGATE